MVSAEITIFEELENLALNLDRREVNLPLPSPAFSAAASGFKSDDASSITIPDISAQHNLCRKKWTNFVVLAFIKKNSYAKLIVLRWMVTRYIWNIIAFLRCHYAYLSIIITRKLSALNHN